MAAPFSPLDGWEMNATCFQGSIFLEENHGNKLSSREEQYSQQSRAGMPTQDIMSYWGYKFETLSLLPQPWYPTPREYIETREDQVVSNYAQYCSVARTGYGKIKMIIGGEVDAGETSCFQYSSHADSSNSLGRQAGGQESAHQLGGVEDFCRDP